MDFGKALTYPFKDPEWLQKILLTSLMGIIPFFGWFFVLGWSLEITRRVIQDDPVPLPRLDVLNDFVRGIKGLAVNIVYSLPALVVVVPVGILIGVTSVASDSRLLTGVNLVTALCLGGVSIFYGIFLMFILPAAYGHLAAHEESLGAALNFKAVFRTLRAAPAGFLLVVVGQIIAGLIASLGAAACIIGIVVTTTYTFSIMGHLYGQAYKEAQANESAYPSLKMG